MDEKGKTSTKSFKFPREVLNDFMEACAFRGHDPNTIVREAVENYTYHGQAAIESAYVAAIMARKAAGPGQKPPD